jgi:hypothetical protein
VSWAVVADDTTKASGITQKKRDLRIGDPFDQTGWKAPRCVAIGANRIGLDLRPSDEKAWDQVYKAYERVV